jgi:hypothetical protein
MRTISIYLGIGLMTLGMVLADQSTAEAQYPYTITPMQTVVTPLPQWLVIRRNAAVYLAAESFIARWSHLLSERRLWWQHHQ